MAHYAELGVDNVVKKVLYIDTIKCMTNGGIEQESIGREYLEKHHGGTWMKCSYNTNENEHREGKTPFRGNYPCGNGNWKYDSTLDKFCEISPPLDKDGEASNSWTLNTTTGKYDPPIAKPSITNNQTYVWDESAYQADNTQGWVDIS